MPPALISTLTALALTASGVLAGPSRPAPAAAQSRTASPAAPSLRVTTLARGLDIPWDVKELPSGRLLITERDRKRLLTSYRGRMRRVAFPAASVFSGSETGLMSLAVDPGFTRNRRFYTCQGAPTGRGRHDVRVLAWRLNKAATRARLSQRLLTGLPSTSGRHGGCRLLILRTGALLVGTGDAVIGTNPRNLGSLGGKTLRLDRRTGAPWPSNPFIRSGNRAARYVLTYGHRNVQGLAERRDGTLWAVEHGPDRDDEINLLQSGGDYGWNPVPGYNERVPMTDQSLPGPQLEARWSSGVSTLATSGATWISGRRWGSYDGTLAVAALKAQRVWFFRFDAAGRLVAVHTPAALRAFGRLRSLTQLADGDLAITTSNGGGRDRVLRVHPLP